MEQLLELQNGIEEASALAAPYINVEDRKEVYLKYLVLNNLQKYSELIDMSASLFYGRKFYTQTRLFDFYVNNNLFDLVILKPDSNEMLFDIPQDEYHSNIFGYVVVRVMANGEKADVLGYFKAVDFNDVVSNNVVMVTKLMSIEDFIGIEIMESPMTLDDVSERFFGLLSEFFDETISDEDFSELACLMYNSAELRTVYSDMGRFDKVCSELKTNSDLLRDDFLSVFSETPEETLEYEFDGFDEEQAEEV